MVGRWVVVVEVDVVVVAMASSVTCSVRIRWSCCSASFSHAFASACCATSWARADAAWASLYSDAFATALSSARSWRSSRATWEGEGQGGGVVEG